MKLLTKRNTPLHLSTEFGPEKNRHAGPRNLGLNSFLLFPPPPPRALDSYNP